MERGREVSFSLVPATRNTSSVLSLASSPPPIASPSSFFFFFFRVSTFRSSNRSATRVYTRRLPPSPNIFRSRFRGSRSSLVENPRQTFLPAVFLRNLRNTELCKLPPSPLPTSARSTRFHSPRNVSAISMRIRLIEEGHGGVED